VPSRPRKTWKVGTHGSHGHSPIYRHRKLPGGLGDSGRTGHHRVNLDRYHPAYFGKADMRHYHLKRNQSFCPADKLWTLVSEQTQGDATKSKAGTVPITDVV
ncbi:unnamed protein product, partial [Gulo gulo]